MHLNSSFPRTKDRLCFGPVVCVCVCVCVVAACRGDEPLLCDGVCVCARPCLRADAGLCLTILCACALRACLCAHGHVSAPPGVRLVPCVLGLPGLCEPCSIDAREDTRSFSKHTFCEPAHARFADAVVPLSTHSGVLALHLHAWMRGIRSLIELQAIGTQYAFGKADHLRALRHKSKTTRIS